MKLIKDMDRDELIELVAAVSLRVLAFHSAEQAFYFLYHLSRYLNQGGTSNMETYTAKSYMMDILYYTLISAVLFLLTIPLTKLLCRGLSSALDTKQEIR